MFDLTQPLNSGVPRFPGDPEVHIETIHEFAPWQISSLRMGTHSGTHMDAPRHRIPEGAGIGAYGPDRLVGHGLVLNARGLDDNAAIPVTVLKSVTGATWPGWFAVVCTGWDHYWGEERYFRHPYLSAELAQGLVEAKAGLVAIDALSVDSTVDGGWAAHAILLAADALIAENLCNVTSLDPVRPHMFAFLPLSLGSADGSPARVVAWNTLG
ncbi:MAG: cyclase family protein [Chloroflexi bacterium]|nr:cyclase family protein [Chloroflexota bacterium]